MLTGSSDCTLTREPIPVWNLVRVLRVSASADLMRQTTVLMDGEDEISNNMPCASMPVSEGEAPAFMHQSLVTSLTGNQPYYTRGGLIHHLTKKGFFWKSQTPAIHTTVLKYKLHIDAENSAHVEKMDTIDCGRSRLFPRCITMMERQDCTCLLVLIAHSRMCSIGLSRMGLQQRQHRLLCHQ